MKVTLNGKKVVLRPLSVKDAPRFCQWLNDPEVTIFLANYYETGGPTVGEERAWIQKQNRDKTKLMWSIDAFDDSSKLVTIGSVGFFHFDSYGKKAEFGMMIGDKRFWGQGCGSEAIKLSLDYVFKILRWHRVYLSCLAYNIRAQRLYKRIGFKVEGRVRDHFFRKGNYHDEIYMGVLREEYLKKTQIQNYK